MKPKTQTALIGPVPARTVNPLAVLLAAAGALLLAAGQARATQEAWVRRWSAPADSDDYAKQMVTDRTGNVIVVGYTDEGITGADMLVVKYSSAGVPLWTNRYNGPANYYDIANAVAVSTNGDVYVTGYSYGSLSGSDYLTLKYSSAGVPLWTNRYNGSSNSEDEAIAVAVDANGNVYVAGNSVGGNDMDHATIKYSSAGVPLWTNRYNGLEGYDDYVRALAVDASGNAFVAGSSSRSDESTDYVTVRYSSAGAPLWTNWYSGPGNGDDEANAAAADASGNVYVTGYAYDSDSNYDYLTIKYSGAGVPLWTNRYDGPEGSYDCAQAIAMDTNGNVYVTGYSAGVGSSTDYATLMYSSAGTPLWTNRYNGPTNSVDQAFSVAVDTSGNVIVTGHSASLTNYPYAYDYATIKYSSAGAPLWTNRYHGPGNGDDNTAGVAADADGSVFVAGGSDSGSGSSDAVTLKYSSAGLPLWTNRYNGPGNRSDSATALAVDAVGNVFVTGSSFGGASSYDYATVAYSSTGLLFWTNRYNGPANDYDTSSAVAVDTNGNVYVTGYSAGVGSGADYATLMYSSAGAPLWTNRYNGRGNSDDYPSGLAVDANGSVYVTGCSATVSTSPFNYEYATIKYSSSGMPLWTNRYNGPGNYYDYARALAVDTSGNVHVTGYSANTSSSPYNYDYATIKYSSAGAPLWTNRYNGPANSEDQANAVVLGTGGNVFVTGYSYASGSDADYATIAYSSAGVPLWTNRYSGPGNSGDRACAVAVDAVGNVYVTGYSFGVGSGADFATIAYSGAGVPLWTNRYNGPANANDEPETKSSLAAGPGGAVYVTGTSDGKFSGGGQAYDFATVKYVTAPLIITQPLSRTNVVGTTATFNVTAAGLDPLYYQWRKAGTNLVEGVNTTGVTTTNLAVAQIQPGDAGDYTVVVTNAYGGANSQVARLTVVVGVPETLRAQILAGGQLRLLVEGSPSRVFTLQGSPDLFHWARLSTHTNQTGTLALINALPAGRREYFYRTVVFAPVTPPGVPAPTLSGARWLPTGRMRFDLQAVAGSRWRVEGSPDLVHWGNYGVVTNASGVLAITNTPWRQPPVYFYRLAQP